MPFLKCSSKRDVLLLLMHYVRQSQSLLWLYCFWIFLSLRLINRPFSIFRLRQQACNGTLQDQWRRWNKEALIPSANVPKSGVSYSVLNQNQHKKGEKKDFRLFAASCIAHYSRVWFLWFFWLKKEPEQMDNAKEDERCLKSDLT